MVLATVARLSPRDNFRDRAGMLVVSSCMGLCEARRLDFSVCKRAPMMCRALFYQHKSLESLKPWLRTRVIHLNKNISVDVPEPRNGQPSTDRAPNTSLSPSMPTATGCWATALPFLVWLPGFALKDGVNDAGMLFSAELSTR